MTSSTFFAAVLALGAALVWAAPSSAQNVAETLRADSVLTPPGGPRTVMVHAEGTAVIALRLHIPVAEAPSEAGAGEILRRMGVGRAFSVADQVGARLEASRTATGITYTVTGPGADFDHLVWVLRTATAHPGLQRFQQVRSELRSELEGHRETAAGVLARTLRTRAAPSSPPPEGTLATLQGMEHETLLGIWRRTHRRDALTLVLVGTVAPEAALAALMDLGSSGGEEAEEAHLTADLPQEPTPDPEVIRHWYGEAYPVPDVDDPRALVAAVLFSERLRSTPGNFEVGVELWEVDDRTLLAFTGAAYPRSASALRARIEGLREEVASEVSSESVERARLRLWRDLLHQTQTPWGLANLMGRWMELSGDSGAAARYVEALENVDREAMEEFLRALAAAASSTGEVRP